MFLFIYKKCIYFVVYLVLIKVLIVKFFLVLFIKIIGFV